MQNKLRKLSKTNQQSQTMPHVKTTSSIGVMREWWAGNRMTHWIREAAKNQKDRDNAMNRDEGAYHLSHIYDMLSEATSSREQTEKDRSCCRNVIENVNKK